MGHVAKGDCCMATKLGLGEGWAVQDVASERKRSAFNFLGTRLYKGEVHVP